MTLCEVWTAVNLLVATLHFTLAQYCSTFNLVNKERTSADSFAKLACSYFPVQFYEYYCGDLAEKVGWCSYQSESSRNFFRNPVSGIHESITQDHPLYNSVSYAQELAIYLLSSQYEFQGISESFDTGMKEHKKLLDDVRSTLLILSVLDPLKHPIEFALQYEHLKNNCTILVNLDTNSTTPTGLALGRNFEQITPLETIASLTQKFIKHFSDCLLEQLKLESQWMCPQALRVPLRKNRSHVENKFHGKNHFYGKNRFNVTNSFYVKNLFHVTYTANTPIDYVGQSVITARPISTVGQPVKSIIGPAIAIAVIEIVVIIACIFANWRGLKKRVDIRRSGTRNNLQRGIEDL